METAAKIGSLSGVQIFYQNFGKGILDSHRYSRFEAINGLSLAGLSILSATIEGPDAAAFTTTNLLFGSLSAPSNVVKTTMPFPPKRLGGQNAELGTISNL